MKTFSNQAAQGDMLLRKIDKVPDGYKADKPENGHYILAHSETGHNHVIAAQSGVQRMVNPANPLMAILVVDVPSAEIRHLRNHDTHEAIEVKQGVYEVREQREYIPEGFRRAID